MALHCEHCGASFHLIDGNAPATCWMCALPIDQELEPPPEGPPTTSHHNPESQRRSGAFLREHGTSTETLALPQNKTIKLFVLSGPSQGAEFEVSRPLMTIGRLNGGADIEIDDLDVSRRHCAIEVRRDSIFLQDLESTNGTYIDDSHIFSGQLEPASIIRIGSSTLRVGIFAKTS